MAGLQPYTPSPNLPWMQMECRKLVVIPLSSTTFTFALNRVPRRAAPPQFVIDSDYHTAATGGICIRQLTCHPPPPNSNGDTKSWLRDLYLKKLKLIFDDLQLPGS